MTAPTSPRRVLQIGAISILASAALLHYADARAAQQSGRSAPAQQQREQQQEERRRAAEERQAQQAERQRQQALDRISGDSRRRQGERGASKTIITPVMSHDPEFDLDSIPLTKWLAETDVHEIPWKLQLDRPALRMDQRLAAPYAATISASDLAKTGAGDLYFIARVADAGGAWLTPAKVVRRAAQAMPADAALRFSDRFLAKPGDYFLSLVLYDVRTGRHNGTRRRIVVRGPKDDPLPDALKDFPPVQLPGVAGGPERRQSRTGLYLPVMNERAIDIRVAPVLSAPEQWLSKSNIARSHVDETTAVLSALAQLRPAHGSVSISGLDLAHASVAFEQQNVTQLNRAQLTQAFRNVGRNTVSLASLQNGGGAAYFRQAVERLIAEPSDGARTLIVVSSPYVFPRGGDIDAVKIAQPCNCRTYYVRLRHGPRDLFDDLDKILKPLAPKTFDIQSPDDFRRALAEIIKGLGGS